MYISCFIVELTCSSAIRSWQWKAIMGSIGCGTQQHWQREHHRAKPLVANWAVKLCSHIWQGATFSKTHSEGYYRKATEWEGSTGRMSTPLTWLAQTQYAADLLDACRLLWLGINWRKVARSLRHTVLLQHHSGPGSPHLQPEGNFLLQYWSRHIVGWA